MAVTTNTAASVLATGLMGVLLGCGSAGSATPTATPTPTPVQTTTPATSMYVTNQLSGSNTAGQVLTFSVSATGQATPTATLTMPTMFEPQNVAVDSGGQIYVSGAIQPLSSTSTSEILIYAAGATGTATPVRTITPAATGSFGFISGMAVDAAGNIYVASANTFGNYSGSSGGSIVVFSSTAAGAAVPTRVIAGQATGLASYSPDSVAVDAGGNIYALPSTASNNGLNEQVLVYGAGANGNVAPTRVIAGATTGFNTAQVYQLAADASGNVYIPALERATGITTVLVFGPSANGDVAPVRTITGANTQLMEDLGIAVDGAGDLYLTGFTGSNSAPGAVVFAAGANGNATPTATFTSPEWANVDDFGLAVH